MRVQIVRQTSVQVAGPSGPFTRVFAIGDVVDVPEIQARIWMAQQAAVHPGSVKPEKPAPEKSEEPTPKPAAKPRKK